MPLEHVAGDPFEVAPLIDAAASKYDIPADRLRAVVQTESNFDPDAQSPAGAQGLMQLMPATAKDLGVTDPFDPAQNVDAGAKYLRAQYDRFGNWDDAHAAYNFGPANVANGKPLPAETRQYIDKINSQVDDAPSLEKVDGDPFAKADGAPTLEKVDGNPFDSSDLSGKSTDQLVKELADMPLAERAARIAAGLPVGAFETAVQMAAQIPQMATQAAGFVKALSEGKMTEQDFQAATASITPQWVSDLAGAKALQPETYSGQLLSRGAGEAFREGGRALAAPGAGLTAAPEMLAGNREAAQQKFLESYEQAAPITEQTLNAGLVGTMAHGLVKGAPAEAPGEAPTAPPADVAPEVPPPQLEHYAGEPLTVFPDGSTMTAGEARLRQLSAADERQAPVGAPPPEVLQATSVDEAISAAADAAELPPEPVRAPPTPPASIPPEVAQLTSVADRVAAGEPVAPEELAPYPKLAELARAKATLAEARPSLTESPTESVSDAVSEPPSEPTAGPRAVTEMTPAELDLASRLTRSDDRRQELQAEIDRRKEVENAPPVEGQPGPEGATDATPVPARTDVQAPAEEAAPGAQAVDATQGAQPQSQAALKPSESKFEDFTRRSDGQLKAFDTAAQAQAYARQRSNRVPGDFAPREVDGTWRLSRAAEPEEVVEAPKRATKEVTEQPVAEAAFARTPPEPEIPLAAEGHLTADEKAVEGRFADQIGRDPQGAVEAYAQLPGSENGRVVSTDVAREASKDYAVSKESRSMWARAVHEPASWIAKQVFQKLLREPVDPARNTVVFTAGGTGAGKTGAVRAADKERTAFTYDTNLNNAESAAKKIDAVLASGRTAKVVYVYRHPVEAFRNGTLTRAELEGRTVPLDAHIETHAGMADSIRSLIDRYRDDPRVEFDGLDNSRGRGNSVPVSVESLLEKRYNSEREEYVHEANQAYANGDISDRVYRGTLGREPPVARDASVDRIDGEKPQRIGPEEAALARNEEAVKEAPPSEGLSVDEVRSVAEPITSGWTNAPDVLVLKSFDEAPQALRRLNDTQLAQGADGRPYAFFHEGRVYLVADEIKSPRQAVTGLFHEALGHYGLRGVFGKDLNNILTQIAVGRRAEVAEVAGRYGLDVLKREERLTAAEEWLAEMAQERPTLSVVQRAIAAVRNFLRERGIDLDWSDNDIIQRFIAPARDWVEKGFAKEAPEDHGSTFHRAYHGSPHDFDRFDASKIGTGEGAQAYGHGLYFAGRKEVADHYRRNLSTPRSIDTTIMEKDGRRVSGNDLLAEYYAPDSVVRQSGGALDKVISFDGSTGNVTVKRFEATMTQTAQENLLRDRGGRTTTYNGTHVSASELRQIISKQEARGWTLKSGRLYEVELAPKEHEYLDWDKAYDQQSPEVRSALERVGVMPEDFEGTVHSGQDVYRLVANREFRKEYPGAENSGDDAAASKALADAGIPGIKYLDGSSRTSAAKIDLLKKFNERDRERLQGLEADRDKALPTTLHIHNRIIGELKAEIAQREQEIANGQAHHNYVIFDDKHVQVTGKFARTRPDAAPESEKVPKAMPAWVKSMNPEMRETLRKAGAWADEKSVLAKIADYVKHDLGMKILQETLDQFAPFKRISEDAYKTLRLVANSSTGGLETSIMYARPKLNEAGVIDVEPGTKGLVDVMKPLKGETERFLSWVAGNRAAGLKLEEREHLFNDADITRLKSLDRKLADGDNFPDGSDGKDRPAAYAKTLQAFNAHGRAFLDIAEKSGIINKESRGKWEKEFYVPFFREADEGKSGPVGNLSGMVNQYAFKKLKGGENVLSDLLANTLQNWSHLLSASLRNNAAREALNAAEKIGVAEKLPAAEKGSVYILENGKEVHYKVTDPLVATAISSLEATPFRGPIMKSLSQFKHILTVGTTMSPVFRVRHTIREQLTALASNPKGWNPVANWIDGFKYSSRDNPEYGRMLAGGSFFRFGQNFDGERAAYTKRLIDQGIDKSTLVDSPNALKAMTEHAWEWWKETGERSDSITRANRYRDTYQMALDKGLGPDQAHKEASYAALDTMDYGLRGTWAPIRVVTQVVPFMNARLQGLYKLGRAANDNPKRFSAVVGGVTLATIALSLAYRGDKDWEAREEWDRDNNWWFKIGNKAFRVPKPFELGALATVIDRATETVMNGMDKASRERFTKRLWPILGSQLNMNPIPQAVFPAIELWANKDAFTGRAIESERDAKLSVSQRIGPHTSATAQVLGKNGVLSPEQIDFLVNAYLGWVGAHAVATADLAVRPLMDMPRKPTPKVDDYFLLGDFVKDLPSNQSRFVEQFYDHMKQVQEAMGDLRMYQQTGQIAKARETLQDNKDTLASRGIYQAAQTSLSQINARIRKVSSQNLDPDMKAAQLDQLYQLRNKIAENAEARRR